MMWGSVSEFLAMGGYGFYVWLSFGATAICMIWEVLALRRRQTLVSRVDVAEEGATH